MSNIKTIRDLVYNLKKAVDQHPESYVFIAEPHENYVDSDRARAHMIKSIYDEFPNAEWWANVDISETLEGKLAVFLMHKPRYEAAMFTTVVFNRVVEDEAGRYFKNEPKVNFSDGVVIKKAE